MNYLEHLTMFNLMAVTALAPAAVGLVVRRRGTSDAAGAMR